LHQQTQRQRFALRFSPGHRPALRRSHVEGEHEAATAAAAAAAAASVAVERRPGQARRMAAMQLTTGAVCVGLACMLYMQLAGTPVGEAAAGASLL